MSSKNISCNGLKNTSSHSDLTFQVCVIGETLKQNEILIKAIEHFHFPIIYSSSGLELINQGGDFTTIYILEEFEGDVFTSLHKAGQRILGPTTVMQYAKKDVALPNNIRPLYTTSMKNLVITFSGFRSKEELTNMVTLVHHMGGSIRKDFSINKTTHLVATPSSTSGEKIQGLAVVCIPAGMGIPIMTAQWIFETWAKRHDVNCVATNEELMQYKLLPFVGCKLAFLGYSNKEKEHMVEITVKNGGEVSDPKDISCSHIVVEDGYTLDLTEYDHDVFILKNEWFWACIQMEAKAEERIYIFENLNSTMTSSSFIMPIRGNKRKRLESVAHQLALESQENDMFSMNPDLKRKTDPKLSISGSFLDATFSPDKSLDIIMSPDSNDTDKHNHSALDMRSLTPRQQVCYELYQTESNYVGILQTIMTVFKEPLENPDLVGGPLLAPAEVKIIFGNLPPLFEIHQKISFELTDMIYSWREDHSIGNVILNHAHELMKSYPPFVNFFEKTKEVLANCDATKPRFHAFLKNVAKSKPECGRQTLQELLIRPVQRLPSVILLLTDILKHTPKSNPDHQALEKAIQSLKDVLMHINEDKRKTEGQVEMFDIVNDIENCPPNLLSSHRNLIFRADLQEVTDMLCKKSGTITMFLFTDVLEICKKKSKINTNSLKSPSVTSLAPGALKPQSKSYKHLELIPLGHIKRVVDVIETESKELKEFLYVFVLIDAINKKEFLRILCRQIANSVCKADSENLMATLEPQQLDLHTSENSGNALTKAPNQTRNKLGRALSMRRTPTKRGLSRAVSTIISPLRNFGSSSNTISSLRLSSVTNLTELEPPNGSLTPSPVGGKKMKSGSLGVSEARYF
ncbi:protein ECT2 [Caerostris extrusa]|uniref:Protein ECT2 n=1 Tax=Caerostris extrusa TaxID=172846 RepID=A0AAV4Y0M1_CAEEX|nr:protein ECT2 [Caerostris extrusa]